MASPAFAELVAKLVEAMGETLTSMRQVAEGLLLRTRDGFVFAFVEDTARVSLASLQRLMTESGETTPRLVIFTPGRLPLALAAEASERGATVVDAARFHELARSLGLETYLGEEPRAPSTAEHSRLLPSAQQLDAIMGRAKTWLDWGVPVLALRFYRQALDGKPGFSPARLGVARALLALGLPQDADHVLDEVLADKPDDLGARMGKAAVLGATGHPKEEIAIYSELLREDADRSEVQAHLVAALVDLPDWPAARDELRRMLRSSPEDPRLRFLHGVALHQTGHETEAAQELARARSLGLSAEAERALAQHTGWEPPGAYSGGPPPSAGRTSPRPRSGGRTSTNRARPKPSRTQHGGSSDASRARRRKAK